MASVEIEDGEVRLTALKNGRTRVAVSGADKKVKAALRVIVGANAVTLRKDAPRAAEIAAVSDAPAWSLCPISAEVTQDGVKCAFYVLNDTGENLARLENLTLTLAARSRNNVIARGAFNSLRVNLRKGRYAIVKLTLEATEALDFQRKSVIMKTTRQAAPAG